MRPARPRLTLVEWASMDEDQPGELVDGFLMEEEVPSILHESVVGWLMVELGGWARSRRGWVFGSELKLGVSAQRGRKADVSMYLPGAKLRGRDALTKIPPDVVIEVASPHPRDVRRDRVDKLGEYAAFGVRFYWLLNPDARILEILELNGDGNYTILKSEQAGKVEVPGCEGLVIDLDQLWSETDRLLPEVEDEESAP
ncbi:MAG: Uma2 family endonuclease [Byssovorax sp.]